MGNSGMKKQIQQLASTSLKLASKLSSTVLAVTLVAAFAVSGCSQDPLKGQPDNIRNGVPPEKATKPIGKGTPKDNLFIDAPSSAQFIEGKESVVQISGRQLADDSGRTPQVGQDFDLKITNLADFPLATFDAASGSFKWTPQVGYVDQNYTTFADINIVMTTRSSPPQQIDAVILGAITRAAAEPTILSIDDLSQVATMEGKTRNFKIRVSDPHSIDQDNLRPRLIISATQGGLISAANFIKCSGASNCKPTLDPTDASGKTWIFDMTLDLANQEVTQGSTNLVYGVSAVSRFGESSAVQEARVKVITSVKEPVISWPEGKEIEMVAGQENLFTFLVIDPSNEGILTVNFTKRCDLILGAASSCSCTEMDSSSTQQICKISWKPASSQKGVFKIELDYRNENKYDPSHAQDLKGNFKPRTLKIITPAMSSNSGAPTGAVR